MLRQAYTEALSVCSRSVAPAWRAYPSAVHRAQADGVENRPTDGYQLVSGPAKSDLAGFYFFLINVRIFNI